MDLYALGNRVLREPEVVSVRPPGEFYVSSSCSAVMPRPYGDVVVGGCHRSEWYRYMGYEKTNPPSDDQLRKMYWGDVIEAAEILLYQKMGIWIESQVSFFIPRWKLKGRIDCFVRNVDSWTGKDLLGMGPTNGRVGVDVKSTWSRGSQGTIEASRVGTKPMPKMDHVVQCALYHDYYRGYADYWKIVYLARDTGNGRDHIVLVTDKGEISVNGELQPFTMDHIWHRSGILWEKLNDSQNPPLRDFTIVYDKEQLVARADCGEFGKTDTDKIRKGNKVVKGDWQCKYCDWASLCWKGVALPFDVEISRIVSEAA